MNLTICLHCTTKNLHRVFRRYSLKFDLGAAGDRLDRTTFVKHPENPILHKVPCLKLPWNFFFSSFNCFFDTKKMSNNRNSSLEIALIEVTNDSGVANQADVDTWKHCLYDQFPTSNIQYKDGKVEVTVGVPHSGYTVETSLLNDNFNGASIIRTPGNVVFAKFEYVNGKATGACELNYEDGKLFFRGYLKDGYREGTGTEYDKNGNVIFNGNFQKGVRGTKTTKLNGFTVESDTTGNPVLAYKENKKGLKHGMCYYYLNGNVSRGEEWEDGKMKRVVKEFNGNTMVEYDKKGNKVYEGSYVDSLAKGYPRYGKGFVSRTSSRKNGDRVQTKSSGMSKCGKILVLSIAILIVLAAIILGIIYSMMAPCSGYFLQDSFVVHDHACKNKKSFSPFKLLGVQSIEIGNNCFISANEFRVSGLRKLTSLKVGSNSFTDETTLLDPAITRSFHISNCRQLESIEISESSFSYYGELFELLNLPALQSLKIGTIGKESNNFMNSPLELKGLKSLLC